MGTPRGLRARYVLGTLYRGAAPAAHNASGLLVARGGSPEYGILDLTLPLAEARRLVGAPLVLACYRGPLIHAVAVRAQRGPRGRSCLALECEGRAPAAPLGVLDPAPVEIIGR